LPKKGIRKRGAEVTNTSVKMAGRSVQSNDKKGRPRHEDDCNCKTYWMSRARECVMSGGWKKTAPWVQRVGMSGVKKARKQGDALFIGKEPQSGKDAKNRKEGGNVTRKVGKIWVLNKDGARNATGKRKKAEKSKKAFVKTHRRQHSKLRKCSPFTPGRQRRTFNNPAERMGAGLIMRKT